VHGVWSEMTHFLPAGSRGVRVHRVFLHDMHARLCHLIALITSGPKFTILWGHLEDILLLNKFFPIVDACLSFEDIARQSCAIVPRWRFLATFLRPVFSASRMHAAGFRPAS